MSTFDETQSFFQMRSTCSIPLAAFCTPSGLYEWLPMLQGAAYIVFILHVDDAVCHYASHVKNLANPFRRTKISRSYTFSYK